MNRKNKVTESIQEHEVQIFGRHMSVTDAMKAYALEKFNKIDKFSFRVVDAVITMDIQREDKHVDILARVNNTKIRVSASTPDMYASIDKANDRLQTKLRKYKRLLHDHHAKSHAEQQMNVSIIRGPEDVINEINDDIEATNQQEIVERFQPHEIVSTELRSLKILNQHEAIMKMELSGDIFMLYRCEEDQKLKVIYRRNDGNYGIIEPEAVRPKGV